MIFFSSEFYPKLIFCLICLEGEWTPSKQIRQKINFGYLGRYQEALEKHQEALAIRKQSLPLDHLHIAESLDNVGECLYHQGRYQEALEKYREALAIRKQSLPLDHLHIALSLRRIGSCFLAQNKCQSAYKYYDLAYLIVKQSLGSGHPLTLSYWRLRNRASASCAIL